MAVSPGTAGNWRAAMLYGDLLELRITLVFDDPNVRLRPAVFTPDMLNMSIFAGRKAMPILQALSPYAGREPLPPPSAGGATIAHRHGVLPMPTLAWNAEVEHDTAHLYERVRAVVP